LLLNYKNVIIKIRKPSFLFLESVISPDHLMGYLFDCNPVLASAIMHLNASEL
jgi:hypothetical protein